MKNTILLFVLLLSSGLISLYSQTTVGRQQVDQFPITSSGQLTYGLTWLPTDYNSTSDKYPLIIFLHGSGECGDGISGLNKLISTALPMKIAQGWNPEAVNPADGKNYKFIVVSPQAPASSHWSYSYTHVRYILADILKRYRVDESRIYITGLSAGGGGTWSSVTNDGAFTQRIAAIAPVSATGPNNPTVEQPNVQWIGGRYGVKVWAICGEQDGHFTHNRDDVNTINNANPKPDVPAVLTLIPGAGHTGAAWNTAYEATWRNNPFKLNVYEWMLQYHRGGVSNPPANLPPVAKAGNDRAVTLPVNNTDLDGGGSSDADGKITSYKWEKTNGPATFTIAQPGSAATAVTGLVEGTYTFQLTVTDDKGATAKDEIKVTVNPANKAPLAKAGNDMEITLPKNDVDLDGSASSDPDGTIKTYKWEKTAGPTTFNIANANAAATSVTGLTEGTYTFQLTVTDDKDATARDEIKVTVHPANKAPVARAGNDVTITLPKNDVDLDGSGSSDADGTIKTYKWEKTNGPATFTIAQPGSAATAVTGLVEGTYTFQLTVTDDKGATAKDEIKVTVHPANKAPVARAGNDVTITLPKNDVDLDGSGSSDADGTIKTYKWEKTAGPAAFNITNANAVATSVTGLAEGTYTFQLTVTDDKGATAKDEIKVTVNPANKAPVARAGNDMEITLPKNDVDLDGSASSDPDGTIKTYKWEKTAGPATFTITTPASATTSVTGLVEGTYTFQLTVTDDKGAAGKDELIVTVNPATPPANQAPLAKAGNDTDITLPDNSVSLDGGGSTDPDGSIVKYNWTKIAGPASFTITNAVATKTTVTGLTEGTYTFQLTVTDDKNATAKDEIKVTVYPANKAPQARAGNDIEITLPKNNIDLDASASSDADGTIKTYKWEKTAGPSTFNITNVNAAATSVTGLTEGTYTFQLTVTDDKGATAKDELTVKVNPKPNTPPVAKAGNDTVVAITGNSFALDGSASYDPDGTIVSYSWVKLSGPSPFTMSYPKTVHPFLNSLLPGVYEIELTVTDDKGATGKDRIKITVTGNTDNKAPVPKAGDDQTITLPQSQTKLDGTASIDAEGMIQVYHWKQVSGPSDAQIEHPNAAQTMVTGLKEGTYEFELTVTDEKGLKATDRIVITVAPDNSHTDNAISIYPVPITTTMNVKISSDKTGQASITMYAANGAKVLSREFVKSATEQLEQLNVTNLQPGVYMVIIKVGDDIQWTRKVVK